MCGQPEIAPVPYSISTKFDIDGQLPVRVERMDGVDAGVEALFSAVSISSCAGADTLDVSDERTGFERLHSSGYRHGIDTAQIAMNLHRTACPRRA